LKIIFNALNALQIKVNMAFFNENVIYLETNDMNTDDKLVSYDQNNISGKVVIMMQSLGCGHCVKAKPEYQKFANWTKTVPNVSACTIQFDSAEQTTKELGIRMKKLIPGFRGLPAFVLYENGEYVKTHKGPRTSDALQDFVNDQEEEEQSPDSAHIAEQYEDDLPQRSRRI